MDYKPTIGLEIHIELKTNSKMFCSCENDPDEKRPNFNVCPICMGHPGTLPTANEEAIKKVIKTGLALNCKIAQESKFDRKNYFYPDLPKGYQISQYNAPPCTNGFLEIQVPTFENAKKFQIQNSKLKKIRIKRIHLEEDTGRLLHPEGTDYSLVDFNRAGVPLMELVTEPDIESGKEARKFAEELQLILRYLGVSDADMEKGQMRVEVNISLIQNPKSKIQNPKLGTKVEIKNLNSFRVVEKAVDYEIKRQMEILEDGKKVIQETRGWQDKKEITFSQREKEEAHDYRYFPEPDLPAMHFDETFIEAIKSEIPELPGQKRNRLKTEYGIDDYSSDIFARNKDLGEYFEKVISEFEPRLNQKELSSLIKLAVNYITTDLQALIKAEEFVETKFKITPENFAEFITLIHRGEISSKIAKIVLKEMFDAGKNPSQIIEERGLVQIGDEAEIENIIKEVLANNPKAVEDYKKGKLESFQFLIGKVMFVTKGRANPEKTRELLKKLLS